VPEPPQVGGDEESDDVHKAKKRDGEESDDEESDDVEKEKKRGEKAGDQAAAQAFVQQPVGDKGGHEHEDEDTAGERADADAAERLDVDAADHVNVQQDSGNATGDQAAAQGRASRNASGNTSDDPRGRASGDTSDDQITGDDEM
jgi:hypothetical protein